MTDDGKSPALPKRLLLATDLSARCDRALDRAAQLAAQWRAELVALHAMEAFRDEAEWEERLPSWRRAPDPAQIALEQLRQDVADAAVRMTAVVERGDPAEAVLRAVVARQCDLIVTGLARDETLGRLGLGATVNRLLRSATVPLLIVKRRARSPYRKIVVGTDFSDPSQRALETALRLFPEQPVTLFHAYDSPMARITGERLGHIEAHRAMAEDDLAAFLDAAPLTGDERARIESLLERGNPRRLIQQYAHDRGVDLIVLGTHGRSGLLNVMLGSTTRDVLSVLSCDALIVRHRAP
jgi:nucleotide-binding universal stress UspA family protein